MAPIELRGGSFPVQDVGVDTQGPERPDDLAAFAEAYVAAERAAVGAVEATMSGRDIPDIEAALEARWDRVDERLDKALDKMWRVRRSAVTSHRTIDGVTFEVRIDPWSPRRAKKLQRVAAPTPVTVRPY